MLVVWRSFRHSPSRAGGVSPSCPERPRRMKPRPCRLLAPSLLLLVTAAQLDAQVRRGRDPQGTAPWAPVAIGVRGGWDQKANGEVLGAHVRIPVLRTGVVELVPNADVVFLEGAKDYQYGVEAAWIPGGVRGGAFVVGGLAWRDTPIDAPSPGESSTFFGGVLGVGVRSRVGPLELELGLRWTFLNDTSYRPNSATIGVNYPLWSARTRRDAR